jgi:catechol 2,3-dioxygenase-like lactoylglutathione lyase family enzyme
MPEYSLHHIHHEAADVDAAVQFYEKNFGAALEERTVRSGAQWARVRLGSTLLNISDRATTQLGLDRYQGLDHFAIQTSDFDSTIATLRANGVNFWSEPMSPRPGTHIAFISGPDHIKIEIIGSH